MRFLRLLPVLAVLTIAQPAWGQAASSLPQNALGLGFGESFGCGLVYQRLVTEGLRARLNVGVYPFGEESYRSTKAFLGGGLLQDIARFPNGRTYLLGTGLYKQVASNEAHLSLMPGLGVQWGSLVFETGPSFFRTDRDGGNNFMYVTWGVSWAVGLGMVGEF